MRLSIVIPYWKKILRILMWDEIRKYGWNMDSWFITMDENMTEIWMYSNFTAEISPAVGDQPARCPRFDHASGGPTKPSCNCGASHCKMWQNNRCSNCLRDSLFDIFWWSDPKKCHCSNSNVPFANGWSNHGLKKKNIPTDMHTQTLKKKDIFYWMLKLRFHQSK